MIVNYVSKAASCIKEGAVAAYNNATNTYACFGRRIVQLTHDMVSPKVAAVVARVYNSMPFTIGTLALVKFTPAYVPLALGVAYTGAHLFKEWMFSQRTYKLGWDGVSCAALVCAARNTMQFIATRSRFSLAWAAGEVVGAAWAARHSDGIRGPLSSRARAVATPE